jgi:catechol 2,3-dioxygenase-like lactoylglutathione lyase family enzyme
MTDHLELRRVSHLNAITDGYAQTVSHFRDRLGFQLNMEIPDRGDGTEACLMTLGRVMFEFFAPKERSERGQGRLLDRFGDHYIGIEYEVPDVPLARELCVQRGIRIINDPGNFFFTHPGACLGIALELWDQNWLDPRPEVDVFEEVYPAEYWRDEHPLGVLGLARLGIAVEDLDAAIATAQDVVGARLLRRLDRPRAAATAAQLQVGDAVWELLAPTGDGAVSAYLTRYGPRIRSTVFAVDDLGRVERHLSAQGFSIVPGDAEDTMAIPPEQNKNLLFEFTEDGTAR